MADSTLKPPIGLELHTDIEKITHVLEKSTLSATPTSMENPEIFAHSSATKRRLEQPTPNILSLPDELLLQIIKPLDPIDAVIFGLTHSRFHRMVSAQCGRIYLWEIYMGDRRGRKAGFFWQRLEPWMGSKRVYSLYADKGAKFVTRERADMLEEREKSPWKFGAFGKVTWRE